MQQKPEITGPTEIEICKDIKAIDYDSCPEDFTLGSCNRFLFEQITGKYNLTLDQLNEISPRCFRLPDFVITS